MADRGEHSGARFHPLLRKLLGSLVARFRFFFLLSSRGALLIICLGSLSWSCDGAWLGETETALREVDSAEIATVRPRNGRVIASEQLA